MGKITKQRSFALVGEFMGEWAAAELMVDDAIAEALDLDLIQYLVIGSKLSVRNKLEILVTLINLSLINGKEKDHFFKQVTLLTNLKYKRDIIAHSLFARTSDESAIIFFRVRTKKKQIKALKNEWSEQTFNDYFEQLRTLSKELKTLAEKLKEARAYEKMAEAMKEAQMNPFTRLPGLSSASKLSRLLPDSDPVDATAQKSEL